MELLDLKGAIVTIDAMGCQTEIAKAIRVGVRSDEGPSEITDEADVVLDGTAGVTELLAALAAD